eukprot:658354-Prymnesium_polylepis.5
MMKKILELSVPWPRQQDLPAPEKVPCGDDLVVALSHGWPFQVHPDPLGSKVVPLKELSAQCEAKHKPAGSFFAFVE